MQIGDFGSVGIGNKLLGRFGVAAAPCPGAEPNRPDEAMWRRPDKTERVTFYRGIAIGIAFAMPLWCLLIWGFRSI